MELRHLKYFLAVAEELHFSKAAARLNISQPPLSQQIAQLENELGVELFTRSKRHTKLTDAGNYFLEQSYEILHHLEKVKDNVRRIHHGETGQLEIGYVGILNSRLIHLFRTFRLHYPKVEVVLHHLSSSNQVRSLRENRIKLAFLCPPVESSFHSRIVGNAPFLIALPSTHPLANDSSPLDIRELKDEHFILTPRKSEPGYYDTIISICNQAGFSPKIFQEAEGIIIILTLVSAGMGVTLVSNLALEYANPGVVFRPIANGTPAIELTLAWRKDEKSPVVNNFLTLFNEMFKTPIDFEI